MQMILWTISSILVLSGFCGGTCCFANLFIDKSQSIFQKILLIISMLLSIGGMAVGVFMWDALMGGN